MTKVNDNRSVGLLFSGGLDTMLEAVEHLDAGSSVHLLTFNNGLCVNMASAADRVEELRRIRPSGDLHHAFVDTSSLRRKLLRESKGVLWRFKSPLLVDLACKMAAVIELIHYGRTRGLSCVTDGTSKEQDQIFLQQPEMGAHVGPLFDRYGVKHADPILFELTRKEKVERLRSLGLEAGPGFLEVIQASQIMHQPFCLYGLVTFCFTSPLRHLPPVKMISLSLDQAKKAWDILLPIAVRELDERLEAEADSESLS